LVKAFRIQYSEILASQFTQASNIRTLRAAISAFCVNPKKKD
jgi:hypothetical protein